MGDPPDDRTAIQHLLAEQGDGTRLWVLSFVLTHFAMSIAIIHNDDYAHPTDILCHGTIYFKGEVQAGPFFAQLHEDEHERYGTHLVLSGAGGEFLLRCSSVRLLTRSRVRVPDHQDQLGAAEGERL